MSQKQHEVPAVPVAPEIELGEQISDQVLDTIAGADWFAEVGWHKAIS
jgi:hypothetical protein